MAAGLLRRSVLLVSCLASIPLAFACAPTNSGTFPSFEPDSVEPPVARITASLESWFTALARASPEAAVRQSRMGAPNPDGPFEFALDDASHLPAEGVRNWIEALRTPHLRVEYRLAGLAITEAGPAAEYRVRFALERRAVDDAGLDHIALSNQTWRIRSAPGGALVVTQIATEPRLVFPGTGPQIVCY